LASHRLTTRKRCQQSRQNPGRSQSLQHSKASFFYLRLTDAQPRDNFHSIAWADFNRPLALFALL
jgi:hypothetical protein